MADVKKSFGENLRRVRKAKGFPKSNLLMPLVSIEAMLAKSSGVKLI